MGSMKNGLSIIGKGRPTFLGEKDLLGIGKGFPLLRERKHGLDLPLGTT